MAGVFELQIYFMQLKLGISKDISDILFINYTNLVHRSYGFSKATPFGVWGRS